MAIKKLVVGCLPKLCRVVKAHDFTVKMLNLFQELAKSTVWGVRRSCAEALAEFFSIPEESDIKFTVLQEIAA